MANCSCCGQPLTEFSFHKHYLSVCNNWKCLLHKEPQGYREKTLAEQLGQKAQAGPVKAKAKSSLRPGYYVYLETKKQNYQHLRDLGVGSKEAAALSTSNKRTREIERVMQKANG